MHIMKSFNLKTLSDNSNVELRRDLCMKLGVITGIKSNMDEEFEKISDMDLPPVNCTARIKVC